MANPRVIVSDCTSPLFMHREFGKPSLRPSQSVTVSAMGSTENLAKAGQVVKRKKDTRNHRSKVSSPRKHSEKSAGKTKELLLFSPKRVVPKLTKTMSTGQLSVPEPVKKEFTAIEEETPRTISRCKIFVSYYQWELHLTVLKDLLLCLKEHDAKIINDDIIGHPLDYRISKARDEIKEADIVLAFLSKGYKCSPLCKAEATHAKNLDKPVILLNSTNNCDWKLSWPTDFFPEVAILDMTSESGIFHKTAAIVFEELQKKCNISNVQVLNIKSIRVKQRVFVPVFDTYFTREDEETKIVSSLRNWCDSSTLTDMFAITGDQCIGKSAIMSHILTASEYEQALAVDCYVKYIAWMDLHKLSKQCQADNNLMLVTFLSKVLKEIEGDHSSRKIDIDNLRLEKIGRLIDSLVASASGRFLLVVDSITCSRDFLNLITSTNSQCLRCVVITRDVEDIRPDSSTSKYCLAREFGVDRLQADSTRTVLKATFENGKFDVSLNNNLATFSKGFPVAIAIMQYFIKEGLAEKLASFLHSSDNGLAKESYDFVSLAMLEAALELDEDDEFRVFYCHLLFINRLEPFSTSDLCVLTNCNMQKAQSFLEKCYKKQILTKQSEVFVIPECLYNACLVYCLPSAGDLVEYRRKLVTLAMLSRALEFRREALLLQALEEALPSTIGSLCYDQSATRSKTSFLQQLYNTTWIETANDALPRNVSADIVKQFITKLHLNGVNTKEIATLPDSNSRCLLLDISKRNKENDTSSDISLDQQLHFFGIDTLIDTVEERYFWTEEVRRQDNSKIAVAAIKGQLSAVHDPIKSKSASPADILAAFVGACATGKADVARFLTWNGAKLDKQDAHGDLPLVAAARNGHDGIVEFLIDNNADVNAKTSKGVSALMATAMRGWIGIIEYLLDNEAELDDTDEQGYTALMRAVEVGHTDMAHLLLSEGADAAAGTSDGRNAMLIAAEKGHSRIISLLLSVGVDVNFKDKDGITALYLATLNGYAEAVGILLRRKACVNVTTVSSHSTALIAAVKNSDLAVVDLLMQYQADVLIKDSDGHNAFMHAVKTGRLDLVERLSGKGFNKLDQQTGTSLILAISYGHVEVAEYLIVHGANVNAPQNSQTGKAYTVLMHAAQAGNVHLAKLLVSRGANVSFKLEDDTNAILLAVASRNSSVELVEFLRASGADLNSKINGWNLLTTASLNGKHDIINWLIQHGADVNAKTDSGATALMAAVRSGKVEAVRCLIANNANINVKTIQGVTALMLATACGHNDIRDLLVAKGAGKDRPVKLEDISKICLLKPHELFETAK